MMARPMAEIRALIATSQSLLLELRVASHDGISVGLRFLGFARRLAGNVFGFGCAALSLDALNFHLRVPDQDGHALFDRFDLFELVVGLECLSLAEQRSQRLDFANHGAARI